MRPGVRLQLVLALGALFALAFVPLYFAVASLTRATLRTERESHARAIGRVVAAHIAEARARRSAGDLGSLLDAQIDPSSGLFALALYDTAGVLETRAGDPSAGSLLPSSVRPDSEQSIRARWRHGPALLVLVPGPRGAVLAALRLDDGIGASQPLLRLVALYTVLVAGVLLLFVTFALTRLVVRPIDALSQSARRVATGGRRLEPPAGGAAELVDLGESLATMTGSLIAKEEQLRGQVDALERATTELRLAQDQVIRAERLASVGRLAAGLAHEVGNPLAALMGLEDLLLDGGLEPDEQRDFLGRMRRETERIHRIVRDLLDFARPAPVMETTEPARLDEALDEIVSLLRPQRKMREVTLEVHLDDGLPAVRMGHAPLLQVLLNLVDNAADALATASPPGGHVWVRGSLDADAVVLTVDDDGPGIDPRVLDSLFEPFVTTKPPGEGTGLGLAVCRGLVESAGGQLLATPRSPRGARFTVRLPRV